MTKFTKEEKIQYMQSQKKTLADLTESAELQFLMEGATGNQALRKFYSKQLNKLEPETHFINFSQIKSSGLRIIKGSKAFKFWSKPIKAEKESENPETKEKTEKKYSFFGIANIFEISQLEGDEDKINSLIYKLNKEKQAKEKEFSLVSNLVFQK